MLKKITRYPDKVMQFAVQRRMSGQRWVGIQNAIEETYKIHAPTERIMREWVKIWAEIQPRPSTRFISVKVPKKIMAVYSKTGEGSMLVQGSSRVTQAIFDAWKNKKDPMVAWAVEMLNIISRTSGNQKLDEAIEIYRQQLAQPNGISTKTAGPAGAFPDSPKIYAMPIEFSEQDKEMLKSRAKNLKGPSPESTPSSM